MTLKALMTVQGRTERLRCTLETTIGSTGHDLSLACSEEHLRQIGSTKVLQQARYIRIMPSSPALTRRSYVSWLPR